MGGDGPLILTGNASRRLKLLLSHGVELPAGLQTICVGLAELPLSPGQEGAPRILTAGLLLNRAAQDEGNVAGLEDGSADSAGGSERDVQAELAVSVPTLKAIKLSSGAFVEVANVGRPEVPAHLARIVASSHAADGVAVLAPSLAYNLGLALHLHPLLTGAGAGRAIVERVSMRRYDDVVGPSTCVEEREAAEEETHWAEVPQPGSNSAQVPVAREVHLSVVRIPAPDLFAVPKRGDDGGTGSLGAAEDRDVLDGARFRASAAEEETVQAIQGYFLGSLRLVCQGDIVAVQRAGCGARQQLLSNLLLPQVPSDGDSPSPRLLYIRVAKVLPPMERAQAVDIAHTLVKLAGSSSSGIPVGLPGYLSLLPPPDALLGVNAGIAGPLGGAARLEFAGTLLPAWRHLAELLAPMLHPAAVAAGPMRLAVLLHGPSGSGKQTAVAAAAAALGVHVVSLTCRDIKNNATSERTVLEGLKAAFSTAADYRPALLVLRQFNTLSEGAHGSGDSAAARAGAVLADCVRGGFLPGADAAGLFPAPVVLIACAPAANDVAPPLRRCFTHELAVAAPEQAARQALLRSFLSGAAGDALPGEEAWDHLARHTAGLLPKDVRSLAADACGMAAMQVLPARDVMAGVSHQAPPAGPAPALAERHIDVALDHVRLRSAEDLGAPKIPDVRWEDVGGLEDVKRAILDTVELPLKHPELFSGGLRRRSGVLLYGPPGTGKTLLAKAVATEGALNFMSVKGPELINMYVGESERQIRDVFARARAARPCVVFFDELDSLAPARGRGSDSGGVMDRVVSQLLAEIDGVQGGAGSDDVFIVGATNRPDLLDPALLRPGRLDRLLYVGVASDVAAQLALLRALTRKFVLHSDVELEALAARCPPRLTGADVYALCADAWMSALKRTIAQQEAAGGEGQQQQETEDAEEPEVMVCQEDFAAALAELRPSLSEEEILKYEVLRDQYESK